MGGRYICYIPRLCTRFHRMVTANDPSPDTYTLVFISAGFYVRIFLLLSLPPFFYGWPLIEHMIDYLAISGYKFKFSVIIHACLFSKFHLIDLQSEWKFIPREIYDNGINTRMKILKPRFRVRRRQRISRNVRILDATIKYVEEKMYGGKNIDGACRGLERPQW